MLMCWLCVVQSVVGLRSPPIVSARTDSLNRSIPRRRTLTLSVLLGARIACAMSASQKDKGLCVCLHALSSFQRTDRSCARGARPTTLSFKSCFLAIRLSRSHRSEQVRKAAAVCRRRPRLGEPS